MRLGTALAAALITTLLADRAQAGIVVLKNGDVVVGRIGAADDMPKRLVVHWPYGERTTRGILSIPKYRVRWYDRTLDEPSDLYWELYVDEPIDPAWHAKRAAWRKHKGAISPIRSGINPLGNRPTWIGSYTDGEVRVTLGRSPDGFSGTLEVGGAVYRVEGPAPTDGKAFKGIFRRAGERFGFTATLGETELTLTSEGTVYALRRPVDETQIEVPDPPPASRPVGPKPKPKPKGVMAGLPKVGMKYHYHLAPAPGSEMDMVWEVVEVRPTEVRFTMTTLMNGKPVGPPTEQTWVQTRAEANQKRLQGKKPPIETITVAGRKWSCWRIEAAGITTWCPQDKGAPMFPYYVLQKKGDVVTNELERIEE